MYRISHHLEYSNHVGNRTPQRMIIRKKKVEIPETSFQKRRSQCEGNNNNEFILHKDNLIKKGDSVKQFDNIHDNSNPIQNPKELHKSYDFGGINPTQPKRNGFGYGGDQDMMEDIR